MSWFSYGDQLATAASVGESLDAVRRTLADLGAKPQVVGASVVGSLGSQAKMRLLGANFGLRSWLPVKITVTVVDQGSSRVIGINVAEDFGFGSTSLGSDGHFRARCQQVLVEVVEGVRSRLWAPAAEPARLAAADLLALASDVIAWHTMRPDADRDDAAFAVLSGRYTSLAPARMLEEAQDDLDFASRAQTEIERISESLRALSAGHGEDVVSDAAGLIDRLAVIAAECERRATALRL
jgi:hypothetical protein